MFIYHYRYQYPVRISCYVLEVGPSGYYAFLKRQGDSARQADFICPRQVGPLEIALHIWQSAYHAPVIQERHGDRAVLFTPTNATGWDNCEEETSLQD